MRHEQQRFIQSTTSIAASICEPEQNNRRWFMFMIMNTEQTLRKTSMTSWEYPIPFEGILKRIECKWLFHTVCRQSTRTIYECPVALLGLMQMYIHTLNAINAPFELTQSTWKLCSVDGKYINVWEWSTTHQIGMSNIVNNESATISNAATFWSLHATTWNIVCI